MKRILRNFHTKTDEYSFMLKPSPIQGIGVFTMHNIGKGTYLRLFPEPRSRRFKKVKMPFVKYCVRKRGMYIAPLDFARMAVGWYLNNSTKPNAYHRNYRYCALRDIKKGEEITIDYRKL